jgi:hypothetical protein
MMAGYERTAFLPSVQPKQVTESCATQRISVRPRALAAFIFVLVCEPRWQSGTLAFAPESNKKWVLTWSDEFDGPNGATPDAAKWVVKIGGKGWGNNELQYYTSRRQNIRQEKGKLVIEAIKEKFTDADGSEHAYTSGRVSTDGKVQPAVWPI